MPSTTFSSSRNCPSQITNDQLTTCTYHLISIERSFAGQETTASTPQAITPLPLRTTSTSLKLILQDKRHHHINLRPSTCVHYPQPHQHLTHHHHHATSTRHSTCDLERQRFRTTHHHDRQTSAFCNSEKSPLRQLQHLQ